MINDITLPAVVDKLKLFGQFLVRSFGAGKQKKHFLANLGERLKVAYPCTLVYQPIISNSLELPRIYSNYLKFTRIIPDSVGLSSIQSNNVKHPYLSESISEPIGSLGSLFISIIRMKILYNYFISVFSLI